MAVGKLIMLAIGCLLGLAVDANALAFGLYPDPPTKLTTANCQLLREGMNRRQIAALVGGWGKVSDCRNMKYIDWPFPTRHAYLGGWDEPGIHLCVWFDAQGNMTSGYYQLQPSGELRALPSKH